MKEKQGFTTWYLLRGAELLGKIIFPNGKTMEENLYELLRCSMIHEAELDSSITLTESSLLGATNEGMKLSRRHIQALILAVMSSSVNSQEKCPDDFKCSFFKNEITLNDLWSDQDVIRQKLDFSNDTLSL